MSQEFNHNEQKKLKVKHFINLFFENIESFDVWSNVPSEFKILIRFSDLLEALIIVKDSRICGTCEKMFNNGVRAENIARKSYLDYYIRIVKNYPLDELIKYIDKLHLLNLRKSTCYRDMKEIIL